MRDIVYNREIGKWIDADDAEQMERDERRMDKLMESVPRCPVHGSHFVAGVGWCDLDGKNPEFVRFGAGGGCSQCFFERKVVVRCAS